MSHPAEPSQKARTRFLSCSSCRRLERHSSTVILVVIAGACALQPVSASSIRGEDIQQDLKRRGPVSIDKNRPLQLVIIVGSVVLAATLLGSLAWLFRSYKSDTGHSQGWFARIGGRKQSRGAMRKNSFDPNRPGSIYDFGDAGSIDGLSLREKSDLSQDMHRWTADHGANTVRSGSDRTIAALSPLSPMPTLKADEYSMAKTVSPFPMTEVDPRCANDHGLTMPEQAVLSPTRRGPGATAGWQSHDANMANMDVEANTGLPPARRPSFIDRLIAHRTLSHSTMSKLVSESEAMMVTLPDQARSPPARGAAPQRNFTTPAMLRSGDSNGAFGAVPNTPTTTGSALISALGGAFRRVSQHHQQYTAARRKFVPSPRQLPIESDYEGTIGGRDADLPMARRTGNRQLLCGDSMRSPSVQNGYSPMAALRSGQLASKPFPHSPLAQMATLDPTGSPKPWQPMLAERAGQTPLPGQTPGMAGVGTTWLRRMSENPISVVGQQERQAVNKANDQPSQPLKPVLATTLSVAHRTEHDVQQAATGFVGVGAGASSVKAEAKKTRLRGWIRDSDELAVVPPLEAASRRGSEISFVISERSLPSVSRQNSIVHDIRRPAQRGGTRPPLSHMQQSDRKELERMPSLNPHFAATTKLSDWLESKGGAERNVRGHEQAELPLTLLASPATDYDRTRGANLWEHADATTLPSYTSRAKGSSSRSGSKTRGSSPKERGPKASVLQSQTAEEQSRQMEKAMRRQMRRARRAAKRAAKEAAQNEKNQFVAQLPAVQAAMTDHGEVTTTTARSDYKRPEKAVEEKMAVVKETTAEIPAQGTAPWVEDLLMHGTPQLAKDLNAPIFHEKLSGHLKRLPSKKSDRSHHHSQPSYRSRSSGRPAAEERRKRVVSRPSRILSPPESPLTSASEMPDSPTFANGQRRASMPASSSSHSGTRSFLVESRRNSKETHTTITSSSLRSYVKKHPSTTGDDQTNRVVSMPSNALHPTPSRRKLPMPPVNDTKTAVPMSAFEQIKQHQASVYIH